MNQNALHDLLEKTGLGDLNELSPEEFYGDFVHASVVGFTDGDAILIHGPYEGERAELYGRHEYGKGRVAQAMGQAALRNAQDHTTLIYDFQSDIALYATDPNSSIRPLMNVPSDFSLTGHTLIFRGNAVFQQEHPFETVVEYGACVTSRSFVRDQIAIARRGAHASFRYMPMMRNHFLNRCLMEEYDYQLGAATARSVMGRAYMPREDGVARATDAYLQACDIYNEPTEAAQLIVAREMGHMSQHDVDTGIQNAPRILKEGGALVMTLFKDRGSRDPVQADAVHERMISAGFKEPNISRLQMQHNLEIFVAKK